MSSTTSPTTTGSIIDQAEDLSMWLEEAEKAVKSAREVASEVTRQLTELEDRLLEAGEPAALASTPTAAKAVASYSDADPASAVCSAPTATQAAHRGRPRPRKPFRRLRSPGRVERERPGERPRSIGNGVRI